MKQPRPIVPGIACCVGLMIGGPSHADIINVDIDPRKEAHGGDDGIFSSAGGTTWNTIGVDFLDDVRVFNLLDEFGAGTDIDLTFDADGSIDVNARAIELYDGGGTGVLEIKTLVPSDTYDLVIYTHDAILSVSVADLTGSSTKTTGSSFTIELPSDEGEEYVTSSGSKPFDLGGGVTRRRRRMRSRAAPLFRHQPSRLSVRRVSNGSTVELVPTGSCVDWCPWAT